MCPITALLRLCPSHRWLPLSLLLPYMAASVSLLYPFPSLSLHHKTSPDMPSAQPTLSYTRIRDYAERFEWLDPVTKERRVGFNPPDGALNRRRLPFHLRAITEEGKPLEGEVICVGVNASLRMRQVQFVTSGETRWVSDLLIIEIDGVRFNVH